MDSVQWSRANVAGLHCALQVKAACAFVEETGRPAGIGALQDAVDIVRGRKGTLVIAQK